MVNLQTQFIKFHNKIKISFDDNQPLREKRDTIVSNLQDGLKKLYSSNAPSFKHFSQGSYDLATGVYPLSGQDYDIDVGIIFNFSKDDYKPVQVKQWVFNALDTSVRTVEIKRPCVRVQYHQNGMQWFHVDLAIYSRTTDLWGNEVNHIAKGLPGSSEDKKIWELSEPFKLKELLKSKVPDSSDRDQFRRIIRYLKRWKDYKFSTAGSGRPTGIALTACCYYLFSPQKTYSYFENSSQYNDLQALYNVVDKIITTYGGGSRIKVDLPVQPHNNLFEKMTDNQMLSLKAELITMRDALINASNEGTAQQACSRLQKVFGSDFPDS
jgi:hypothetical protein